MPSVLLAASLTTENASGQKQTHANEIRRELEGRREHYNATPTLNIELPAKKKKKKTLNRDSKSTNQPGRRRASPRGPGAHGTPPSYPSAARTHKPISHMKKPSGEAKNLVGVSARHTTCSSESLRSGGSSALTEATRRW